MRRSRWGVCVDGQSVALIAIAGARRALCVLGLAALRGCQSTEPTPGASFHAPVSGTPPFDAATVARADAGAVVDARSIADVGVISNAGAVADAENPLAGFPDGSCGQPRAGARLLAPISGSVVTSSRPLLSFVPGGDGGTDIQVCADRACAHPTWRG